MFGLFTDPIEAGFRVLDDLVEGELPSREDVAALVDAGVSVAARDTQSR